MAWAEFVQRQGAVWAARGIDLVLPPRCVSCLADVEPPAAATAAPFQAVLCGPCGRDLVNGRRRCTRCGEPHETGHCGPRQRHGEAADWDGIAVLGGYADRLREAVLRCKRPAGRPLVRALAQCLVAEHAATLTTWDIDLVVPVPMHWWRAMLRGMSAADELARGVAGGLQLPVRAALARRIATRMQNELPVADRRANVRNAFATRGRVAGRRILLVDDVCTTGSTLGACRRALRHAGAAAVFAAVVAKADRSSLDGSDERRDA